MEYGDSFWNTMAGRKTAHDISRIADNVEELNKNIKKLIEITRENKNDKTTDETRLDSLESQVEEELDL